MGALVARPELVHLSFVLGAALVDGSGSRLGRVDDLIVRLDEDYPPVSGVVARVAGRQVFVPASALREIEPGAVTLNAARLDLQPFERRPQEVLLRKDVLDRQLINVDGARLVRTNEIELARVDGWYRVVGVDTGVRGFARRLLPRRVARSISAGRFLDWSSVEPFTGHVPTVRLSILHPKLARLHPAQVADLVEAASHHEGKEILAAVSSDREREADVFEELDAQHQSEFAEERTDAELAALLARMEADDAADLVNELPQERREPVLELLPLVQRRRVRALLGYDAATAGGLMSPDFVCVYSQATKTEALGRLAQSRASAEALTWLFVMNEHKRLSGAVHLVDLLRAEERVQVGAIGGLPQRVSAAAELEEVARLMTDFDLTVVPVVDEQERMVGVVTVDDVLELVLPSGWRRRFGVLGE